MWLLLAPSELLLQTIESLRDSGDIQALQATARTCRALHQVAEIYLYSNPQFTTLSSFYQFQEAIRTNPKRASYVRDLSLLYSTPRYHDQDFPYLPDLAQLPNLTSFVSESPECQPSSAKATGWASYAGAFMQVFTQASLLNPTINTPRPLQNLKSLTLHWTGEEQRVGEERQRYWAISPACPIFLLPQLQYLEISCARVGQGEPLPLGQAQLPQLSKEQLQFFQGKTSLKSLVFTECVVSVEALHLILSFPNALQRLDLCESYYHRSHGMRTRFAVDDNDAFNRALAQQSESLQHLHIFCNRKFSKRSKELVLSLSNFPVLSHLQLGPNPEHHDDSSNFVLDHPVPPILTSLRLSEQEIISSTSRTTVDRVLSALSVEDLMKNAEARGLPFTLDVVLRPLKRFTEPPHNPRITSLHLFAARFGGVFAARFGGVFQKLREISSRSSTEPSSELPSLLDNLNPISSRLRILTYKYHHKIPPFLHGERPPRFVVRYDSWHPDKFLDNPYTADAIPSDWDISSEDEDVQAAFRSTVVRS